MNITLLLVVVHVFGAIALVAGLVGRQFARAQAKRAAEFDIFIAMQDLAGRFEFALVRPPGLFLAASGIALAYLQGYPLLGFLQGGRVNWLLASNLLVLSVVAVIAFIFIPRGKVYEQRLREAQREGQMTPALRATLEDPVVRAAHLWEGVAVAIIIVLMTTRPF
jgi:hypothetical protein